MFGVEEAGHELVHPMIDPVRGGGMGLNQRIPVMGQFPHDPRLSVGRGKRPAVFFIDEHGGDAEQVEFIGAGELVLPGLGALIGVDADAQVLLFEQGVDEVVTEGGAVLAAEKDVSFANGVFLAQAFDDVLQEGHAFGGIMDIEGPAQLHALAVADQCGVLAFGIIDRDAHDLFGRARLLEQLFDCGIRALEYTVHRTASYGNLRRLHADLVLSIIAHYHPPDMAEWLGGRPLN